MKRWQASCLGALIVLLIGDGSLLFFILMGGAMIAANSALFNKLTAQVLCPDAVDYSYSDYGSAPVVMLILMAIAAIIGGRLVKPKAQVA